MRLKLQPTGRQIIQDFWQPRQKEGDPVKFAEENLRVDDTGPFPNTLWDAAHSPFVIQPLQDYATDGITSTAIMKCAQSGLTECFMNAASWGICESSGSQMWVTSTEDVLRLFWEGRLKVKWERSPVMPSFSKRQKQGTLHLFFPNGILALVPSGSRAQLQSVPCRRIIMDEVRDWPPENYEIAKKRVRSHSEKAMVVTISCPEESGDHVHAAFTSGNQNRWEFLCEGCKKRIPLNFRKDEEGRGGLRWTTSKKTNPGS
jgi:phage terminase large subunit GpA-like protein